jgi:hypothetical protein
MTPPRWLHDGPPLHIGPRTARERVRALAPAAVALLALVLGLHGAALRAGALVGAEGTDTLRAAWGLGHVSDALPGVPWWTDRIGWPFGVKIVILPGASTLLGAPLHALLGPLAGYTAWVLGLLWLSGMATAALVERVTRCGAAAMLAGVAAVVQPVTLMAVTDGTVEHVAFWGLPATLAAVAALRERGAGTGHSVVAGALATVMAFDSPYNVCFALPMLPLLLRGTPVHLLAKAAGVAVLGAALLAFAYAGLPVSADDARRAENSVLVGTWAQWEAGTIAARRPWDFSFGTGFTPVAFLLGGVALAALRPLRSGPWVLVALLCLALGLGPGTENARELARIGGEAAGEVGAAVASFNERFPVPIVRFPRRWLLPLAVALSTGAGIGLTRVPQGWMRWSVAVGAAAGLVAVTLGITGYHRAPPVQSPLQPAFAAFVRAHPREGAVVVVPRQRGATRAATRRDELPVFADLGASLASSDGYWIQALCGRPSTFKPIGLRTVVDRRPPDGDAAWLLQGLDDLSLPQTVGRPLPPSATGEMPRRQAALRALRDGGLGFLVLDDAILGEDGVRIAREIAAPLLSEERHFDEGSGVTVFVLAPTPAPG